MALAYADADSVWLILGLSNRQDTSVAQIYVSHGGRDVSFTLSDYEAKDRLAQAEKLCEAEDWQCGQPREAAVCQKG